MFFNIRESVIILYDPFRCHVKETVTINMVITMIITVTITMTIYDRGL